MPGFWESVALEIAGGLGTLTGHIFNALVTATGPKHASIEKVEPAKYRAIKSLYADELIRRLDDRIPEYARAVEQSVASAIRSSKTSDLLEIKLYVRNYAPVYFSLNGKPEQLVSTARPRQLKWPKMIFNYVRNKPEERLRYEAGVERVVAAACQRASQVYFASPEVQALINEALVKNAEANVEFQTIIMKELESTGKLIKKEAKDAINAHGHAVAADRVHDCLQHAIASASSTTAGAVAAKVITSALAMPVVKAAIAHATLVACGSSAVQSAVFAASKHCGLTVIAIAFFGHTSAATLMGFVALPLIAAVITYQWNTLPKTLAEEMAPKIAAEIKKKAGMVNRNIVANIKEKVVEGILGLSKEALEKIHEVAMEELETA